MGIHRRRDDAAPTTPGPEHTPKEEVDEVDELTQRADTLLVQLQEVLDEMLSHLQSVTGFEEEGDK